MALNKLSVLLGVTAGLMLAASVSTAQVFPPRQTQPVQPPMSMPSQPGQMPAQPSMPQQFGGQPPSFSKTIPFTAIIGDPTKSFIQLGNMRSPFDTNFSLGRGLAGRLVLEKYTYELGNGQKSYIHVSGVSNPPLVTTEGVELRFQFLFPIIQFKTYYKDYSGEGDSALSDLVAEKVLVDVFLTPTTDQRGYPTYHSLRIAVLGSVKEADKCTHFFDVIFPVNICKAAVEYFKQMQPALENSMRELLLQPQTRMQFDQQVFQFVRAELLANAGVNPMSPAQVQILQSSFQGTDYRVNYVLR
ncbi:MAG: hypothetical protein Q7U39_03595 [Nitrospira sp.]|nr:hypothetical protein [Nitrospira sp.]